MSTRIRHARAPRHTGAIVVVVSICVISGLHYIASMHAILVHEILKRLYYVPIVVAAIRYGAQGGLATALLASALYLPHIVISWSNWPVFEVGQYGEIILFNVVGSVTGVMAVRLRTERNRYRKASEELEAAYEQLKVSTEQRLKAERMATVGRVAAGMAHEIRTPLGGLLGCFEILSTDYPPNHQKAEFIDIAKDEIRRVEGVVAAFLDFAQPAPARPQAVDLNDIAERVTSLVARSLAERGAARIQSALWQRAIPVTADAHQLERALVDLLLVVSSLAQNGQLTISTRLQHGHAELAIGVEPVNRTLSADLFEPFGERYIANGLALPVVKRLIEIQGGTVRVETTGRQARFVVELPSSATTVGPPVTATTSSVETQGA